MRRLLLIICFSLYSSVSFAEVNRSFEVQVRTEKGKLKTEVREIEGLLDYNFAQTKHFVVVEGRSQKPVRFDESELAVKAANVLYHLQVAYSFFKDHLGSQNLQEKTIVRIEMKDSFFSEYHWGHEKFATNYNNAATIPPSDDFKAAGVPTWNNEIWFRPPKVIKKTSDLEMMGKLIDNPGYKGNIHATYVERTAINLGTQILSDNAVYMQYELGYLLGMIGFIEIFPKTLKFLGKTHKKKMELDTAMIPEVIYHEFAHIALYDYLAFDEKTPVVEGIANYFAAKMIDYHKIGFKSKGFSKGFGGYNGKSKAKWDYHNETKAHSHSSFLLSMLWGVGEEIKGFEHTVFRSRKYLDKNSDIKYDFVSALEKAYLEENSSAADKMRIKRLINHYFYGSH